MARRKSFGILTALTVQLLLVVTSARSENWAQWRGPAFNGSSTETGLPETWSKTENMLWTAELPGPSGATPIIWDDRVFISSADSKNKDLLALCLNRKDGKILWQKQVAAAADRRPHERKSNMASPSPVTDGKHVFFLYGTGDIAGFDMEGNQIWARNIQKDYGKFGIMWGYGSSPLLYKDKLYVLVLQRDKLYPPQSYAGPKLDSYVLALDPLTGKDIWKHVRETDAKDETRESYSTPIPYEGNGRSEILISDGDFITGHNPDNGDEYWRFGAMNPKLLGDRRLVVSPVTGAGSIFISTPKHEPFYAIKAGGTGKLEESSLSWKFAKEFAPDVCTPLFYNDLLYLLDGDKKIMHCLDPKTGTPKWKGTLPGTAVYDASPTGADGKIYCINEAGEAVVLSAGNEFKILATVPMGAPSFASISASHGELFIRTYTSLYCIGK